MIINNLHSFFSFGISFDFLSVCGVAFGLLRDAVLAILSSFAYSLVTTFDVATAFAILLPIKSRIAFASLWITPIGAVLNASVADFFA